MHPTTTKIITAIFCQFRQDSEHSTGFLWVLGCYYSFYIGFGLIGSTTKLFNGAWNFFFRQCAGVIAVVFPRMKCQHTLRCTYMILGVGNIVIKSGHFQNCLSNFLFFCACVKNNEEATTGDIFFCGASETDVKARIVLQSRSATQYWLYTIWLDMVRYCWGSPVKIGLTTPLYHGLTGFNEVVKEDYCLGFYVQKKVRSRVSVMKRFSSSTRLILHEKFFRHIFTQTTILYDRKHLTISLFQRYNRNHNWIFHLIIIEYLIIFFLNVITNMKSSSSSSSFLTRQEENEAN